MRISTAAMHSGALTQMLDQQALLARTQSQIASGRRVQTPADDPVAAVHLLELDRALNEVDQFGRNANVAVNRLTLEEQALADVGNVLARVRELAIEANSPTIDAKSRSMIAGELSGRLQELLGVANQQDANGEYLFSGFATKTQPFAASGNSINYYGDQGTRMLQVSNSQRVGDSHSGHEVFLTVAEGNGTFVTRAAPANTGSGVISGGSMVQPAQWIPDDYTLRFVTPTTYEIVDSAATVVSSGTYTPSVENTSIAFNGTTINFSGSPEAGDSFAIDRSRTEDVFTTVQNLITTLGSSTATQADRAQFTTRMAEALQQLDSASDHVLSVRAEVGTRLSALDAATESREVQQVELQRMQGELRDLDYAEAITRMNQQLVGLQAAQASYSRISQLSLFDYLR